MTARTMARQPRGATMGGRGATGYILRIKSTQKPNQKTNKRIPRIPRIPKIARKNEQR